MHIGDCCLFSPSGLCIQSAAVKSFTAELQSISREDLWVILRQLKSVEREEMLLKLLLSCGKTSVMPASCTLETVKKTLNADQKKTLKYVDTSEVTKLEGLFQTTNRLLHGVNDHCQCYLKVPSSK